MTNGAKLNLDTYINTFYNNSGVVKAKKDVKEVTGITDALNKSLSKRQGFDENHKRAFDAIGAAAKTNAKDVNTGLKNQVAAHKNATAKISGFWGMNFLTFLFVGQAIKKISQRIATTSINAFTDVAGSGNAASNALTTMQIGFKGISVAIGDAMGSALLPFSDFLFDVIQRVISWVSENQKLVAGIVLGGIALGTFLILLAQFMLALNSIIGIIGTAKAGLMLLGQAGLLAPLGIALLWIAGIAAVFALLWITNLGNFRDFFKETFGIIWETIKSVLGDLWDLIKSVFGLIVAIINGDTEAIKEQFLRLTENIFKIFIKLVIGVSAILGNILVFIINLAFDILGVIISLAGLMLTVLAAPFISVMSIAKQAFSGLFNWIIGKLNTMIDAFNKINPFGDVGKLSLVDSSDSIMDQIKKDMQGVQNIASSIGEGFKGVELGFIQAGQVKDSFTAIDTKSRISGENGSVTNNGGATYNFNGYNGNDIDRLINQKVKTEVESSKAYTS